MRNEIRNIVMHATIDGIVKNSHPGGAPETKIDIFWKK